MGRMKTADKKNTVHKEGRLQTLHTFKRACDGGIIRGKWQTERRQIY